MENAPRGLSAFGSKVVAHALLLLLLLRNLSTTDALEDVAVIPFNKLLLLLPTASNRI